MADMSFNNWAEFSAQFGDLVGETRLEAARRAFKNAYRIIYTDDGVVSVYMNASCKKEAFKNSATLDRCGWTVSTTAAPKNGAIFALMLSAISSDEENHTMTTNAPNTTAAPASLSIDEQIRSLLQACTTANDNATAANNAVAKMVTKIDELTTSVAAASAAATAASNAATAASTAAAEAKKAAAAAADDASVAKKDVATANDNATAANSTSAKTAAELVSLKAEVASLKAGAEGEAKKNKKKDKKEKESSESWTTEEKAIAAVATAAVGFLLYKAVVKD